MSPLAEYRVRNIHEDFSLPGESGFWEGVPAAKVEHYLWLKNGYQPRVEARLCLSPNFLYVFFKAWESRVRLTYTNFQDPVYKDSCVEFFVDPFPEKGLGYINIETNALGTMLIHHGKDRGTRRPIPREDLAGFEVRPSIKAPVTGEHGADQWTLAYRLPLSLFEKYYGARLASGCVARGNFYKCGDLAEFPHYGAWNPVGSPEPDFHLPEYFGRILF